MNKLTNIRVKDNTTGKTYRLLGFTTGGDDRSGWNITNATLYNDDERLRINVNNPLDMKRLTVIID